MVNIFSTGQVSSSQTDIYRILEDCEILCPFELTQEELAIILDEEIEREPSEEELQLLAPGYEQRIQAGVLARISEQSDS